MTQDNTQKPTRPYIGRSRKAFAHRRMLFVEAYIANGNNAADAARQAGYSDAAPNQRGYALLKNEEVRKLLAQRQGEIAKKFALTAEDVIAELAKIVHADMRKLFTADGKLLPMAEWPEDVASAVGSAEFRDGLANKLKLWDKNAALGLAMKHLGILIDRSEVTHRVDIAERIQQARKRSGSE